MKLKLPRLKVIARLSPGEGKDVMKKVKTIKIKEVSGGRVRR